MTKAKNFIRDLSYDKDFDVLYIKYEDNENAVAAEIGPHIIMYLDKSTNLPTVITILDFHHVYAHWDNWKDRIPVEIDFKNDIFPKIA